MLQYLKILIIVIIKWVAVLTMLHQLEFISISIEKKQILKDNK